MAKQRFLVKEILDLGFNQEAFSKFMQSRKESDQVDNALNIDQWTFEELDEAVKVFQDQNKNPYVETKEPVYFYVNKVDETNWEDLEYAEENVDLGRETKEEPRSPIADEARATKATKRFNDPKDFIPEAPSMSMGFNTSRVIESPDPLNDTLSNMFVLQEQGIPTMSRDDSEIRTR